MLNDTLANALATIMNAERIGMKECTIKPSSKVIEKVLELMNNHHYIGEFKKTSERSGIYLTVNLIHNINKCGVIKPRHSVKKENYEKFEKRYLPAKEMGLLIVSTTEGIISHDEAKNKNLGGKLLAFVF